MKRNWSLTPIILLALGGCGEKHDGHAHDEAKPAAKAEAKADGHAGHGDEGGVVKLTEAEAASAGIRTEKAVEAPLRARFTASAVIQPNADRLAHVAPRIPGRLVRVPAKTGDVVRAGQVLAELDSIELGEAQSAYRQAATSREVARTEFERAQKLYREQVVPEKEFLRAKAEHERAQASLQAAADKLRLMGVAATPGAAARSTFPLTAPFAGTVIEKDAVMGELAAIDKSLFTIVDLSTVWIEANLYERDLARVAPGAGAEVTVAAYPGTTFRGKVTYVGGVMDKESRTVKARIEVPNADGRLKPEMLASVAIDAEPRGRGIAIPADALSLVEGRRIAFVKELDGFEAREVDPGEDLGGRVVVRSGLSAGEEVVVAGGYALKARLQKSKIGHGHAH